LQPYDRRVVDEICTKVKANGDRFSSVIAEVIKSYPFQHARGMKAQETVTTTSSSMYDPVPDHPYFVSPPAPPRQGRGGFGNGTPAAGGRGGFVGNGFGTPSTGFPQGTPGVPTVPGQPSAPGAPAPNAATPAGATVPPATPGQIK